MLSAHDLREYLDARTTNWIFRLEVLDTYEVASDGSDFARYLAGEQEPTPARKRPWLDKLAADYESGLRRHRVHVLSTPLNDYLRYECEWSYVPNGHAGEEIYILDLSERDKPDELVDHDFWLTDQGCVVRMYYAEDGQFLGAEPVDNLEQYQRARDAAMTAAEPFSTWWARHPEEWRTYQPQ
ncbi:hypothetical protein RIF23_02030 [Lipingzhangella sp. LS1_29]|uniref:DUF6879 domain-containing protein n=1 Tax=Lipingzhangella rawalii TaxID=2055835 RepID=A0ABU2H199_9ACTN|nr:DUF6879 family protein [Lipingzhangella rawalii]MDS1269069.1 hypothetical protein [Lipingzhangella rawalii]